MEQPQPPSLATQWSDATPASSSVTTVGSLVSHTFGVWKENFGLFAGVSAAFGVLNLLVMWGLGSPFLVSTANPFSVPSPEVAAFVFSGRYFAMMGAVLVFSLLQLAAITAGAMQHLEGRRASAGAMLGEGLRRSVVLFAAVLLSILAVYAGILLLVVPGVIAALAFSLVAPAAIAERLGPVKALGRSRRLTKGHRWKLLGTFVIVYVAAAAPVFMIMALARGVPYLATILNLFASALIGSLFLVAPAVAFHDLRAASEGAGTAELVRVFE